jgi:hypothetical protein
MLGRSGLTVSLADDSLNSGTTIEKVISLSGMEELETANKKKSKKISSYFCKVLEFLVTYSCWT